jgi:hypothetical protein
MTAVGGGGQITTPCRLKSTYSLPKCSQYRIFCMKFDWSTPLVLSLATECGELTNGCTPPILENGYIDIDKTAERIRVLKNSKNISLFQ